MTDDPARAAGAPADGPAAAPDDGPGIPDVAQPTRPKLAWRGIVAAAMALLSLGAMTALSVHRTFGSSERDGADSKRSAERPSAATARPRQLDLALAEPAHGASAAPAPRHVVPAIVPSADDGPAEPIGVRRTGASTGTSKKPRLAPEDAPVMLVTTRPVRRDVPHGSQQTASPDDAHEDLSQPDTLESARRNLQRYQRQLQGLLDKMSNPAATPSAPITGFGAAAAHGLTKASTPSHEGTQSAPPLLFGGQLQGSNTPRTRATAIGDRSLTLPKGTAFTCVLKTRVVSATSGFVGCQTQRNVYGDDGRVLLIERGSHLDGEYRIASVRPGTVRISVLWTRIRTAHGVSVDIASPGTGALGESGIDGHVDNRWRERIGAAMLMSLIDDSVKLVVQNQTSAGSGNTVVLPSTTANTSRLAERVLDSTVNIPPLIYQNQGGIVGVYVARDVDFSGVYALRAAPLAPAP